MSERRRTGGAPEGLIECTDCGGVYPAQLDGDGGYRPIGVGAECSCGNDEFVPFDGP